MNLNLNFEQYNFPENINQKRALKISPVMRPITHCGSSLHNVDSQQLYLQKPSLNKLEPKESGFTSKATK